MEKPYKNPSTSPQTGRKSGKNYSIFHIVYESLLKLINNSFFYFLKVLGINLFKILYNIQAENKNRIPLQGPLIVAANHFSYMDPVALQVVFPRRISFMMTEQFYEGRWKWLFKSFRCICIKGKGANIAALREGIEVLKKGDVLGIFPEGGVSKEGRLQRGISGVGFLAKRSSAPILPVFIAGTYKALPKGKVLPRPSKIRIIYGNPILFERTPDTTKDEIEGITQRIMEEIKNLSPLQ